MIRAKSNGLSLDDHTSHVVAAARTLVRQCGVVALSSFGLSASLLSKLEGVTLESARVHDWGKATSGFQGMLEDGAAQILRHEILSAILAKRSGVPPEVLAVVVGHHRKFHREFWSSAAVECRVIASALGQGEDFVLDQRAARRELQDLLDTLELWAEDLSADEKRFVALARLFLIAADGAASARQAGAARFLSESLTHSLSGRRGLQVDNQLAVPGGLHSSAVPGASVEGRRDGPGGCRVRDWQERRGLSVGLGDGP